MPNILLIRHGTNDYVQTGRLPGRLPGIHLNEDGRKQVEMVAHHITQFPVKAIYSSPLERTMETAKLISDKLHLEVEPRDDLIEVDCGEWQGQRISSLRRLKLWKEVQHFPSRFCFPGGESFFEAQHRICKGLENIGLENRIKDTLVCVSHADPIRLAVAHFLGLHLDMFQRLSVSPASLTMLSLNRIEAHLLMLNYECSFSHPKI
jgi:probable phosphomutase (TIGR03848 family)